MLGLALAEFDDIEGRAIDAEGRLVQRRAGRRSGASAPSFSRSSANGHGPSLWRSATTLGYSRSALAENGRR
jgi:hypothetical protein